MLVEKPNPNLSKEKILRLVARDGGVKIHPNDVQQSELLGRLKILNLRGMVSLKREGNLLRFCLAKDSHLL